MESGNCTNVIAQQCLGLECSMQTSQLQLPGAGSHEGWSPGDAHRGKAASPKAQKASSGSEPFLT